MVLNQHDVITNRCIRIGWSVDLVAEQLRKRKDLELYLHESSFKSYRAIVLYLVRTLSLLIAVFL